MKYWTILLAAMLALGSLDAEAARRLGGGGSIGRQSSNVTQRDTQPAAPAVAPNTAQRQAQPTAPAQQPPAAAPRRPWAGMLGGLAAGLGLAWLAHTLGFGEAFGQFMLIALLVLVVMIVVGLVMRARRQAAGNPASQRYAFGGAGAPAPAEMAQAPRQYSPDKVGNDASARPWERNSMAFDAGRFDAAQGGTGGVRIGSGLEGSQNWGVPAGFDVPGFVEAAKRNFITLQDAWDRGDIPTLRTMMTDEMVAEIRSQLAERERQAGAPASKTEVVMLEAQLLGIEDLATEYLASVEFSGMIREDASAGPSPFREVWNMVKPKDRSAGWLVAGVQALQ